MEWEVIAFHFSFFLGVGYEEAIFLCIVLNLVACTATTKTNVRNEAEAERFDPASMARIRLITGDQMIKGGYVSGFSCEKFFNEATANRPAENEKGTDLNGTYLTLFG